MWNFPHTFLGENIADNGGIKAAFHAYLKTQLNKDADILKLPGLNLTHKQLFFVSFAQVCIAYTSAGFISFAHFKYLFVVVGLVFGWHR